MKFSPFFGMNGGSGGGSRTVNPDGLGVPGQGNDGGAGANAAGGGGGGAGSNGSDATANNGADGGSGLNSITDLLLHALAVALEVAQLPAVLAVQVAAVTETALVLEHRELLPRVAVAVEPRQVLRAAVAAGSSS